MSDAGAAPSRLDRWEAGDAYERYVGRWSRRVAAEFVPWLAVPPGARWLDVGCGTGAVTDAVLRLAAPREVRGIDPSPAFVAHAGRARDDRVKVETGEAQAIDAQDGAFDAVASGLVLNFVPRPERAWAEMARVTRADGIVGLYVWDYAGEMQYMRSFWDAAVALDPAALELDEGRRFPMCRREALEHMARHAGLRDVTSRAIDVPTRFAGFDDYWAPFMGGQGPAPGYAVSLDPARSAALRDHIRSRLPIAADGSIDLIARAWAVRGRR
jgi:SAM-dependent methyltransferase